MDNRIAQNSLQAHKWRLLLLIFPLLLTSCEWDNWIKFRDANKKDFAEMMDVVRTPTLGNMKLKKQMLTQKDARLLTKKEPSESKLVEGMLIEDYRCVSARKPHKAKDDLLFRAHFNAQKKMTLFEFPAQFMQMFPADDASLKATVKAITTSSVNVFTSNLSGVVNAKESGDFKAPGWAALVKAYGEPTRKSHKVGEDAWMEFDYYLQPAKAERAADDGKQAGRKVKMRFEFDENHRLTEMSLKMGSITLFVEVERD